MTATGTGTALCGARRTGWERPATDITAYPALSGKATTETTATPAVTPGSSGRAWRSAGHRSPAQRGLHVCGPWGMTARTAMSPTTSGQVCARCAGRPSSRS